MNNAGEPPVSEQPVKPRRSKSREVASRFLSSPSSTPTHDSGHHSPSKALSPLRRKSTSLDTRKQHRSLDDPSGGLLGGLWPSSTAPTNTSSSSNSKKLDTLADYLGNERLKDFIERKSYEKRTDPQPFSLTKQTSHTEFSRFIENDKEVSAKENHRPSMGGSMRYTMKPGFSRKSSSSTSSSTSSSSSPNIVPGRFSVDENALYKKSSSSSSSQWKPDFLTDNCVVDSEGEISDQCSASKIGSPALTITNSSSSSRKYGIEVSSKYLKEEATRNRSRGITWDSSNLHPVSADSSPKMNKRFAIKNVIRRTNSQGASTSQWALSPGRWESPTVSVENKAKPMSFSNLKPPTSPSRTKGVEKFLNLGLMGLFKSKKSSALQPGSGDVESVHHLRLIHNGLIQWRYANAKADAASTSINNQVQNSLLYGWNSVMKLQHSVLQKKLKLQKEKLEIKLDFILQSQMKALESWADMERQHSSAISMTKESLHAVVCKVPLVEGAQVDTQSASMALRLASDLAASIKSMLIASSPGIEKTVSLVSELAEVVTQEKLLLQECIELFRMISILEIQERSLMCYIIGLNSQQRQIQEVA
ncbi:protein TRANSPARENT TESTA 12-like [Hibiscus syriacus]|uniref:Protein TRANSPARENT TESTA 12-like n=1 Tax=Hibiscus syriacus TaxID=106335 RepID=A0A6A3CF99_HIBSY|nr:QWRF motif-containing protein 3-like [Hibiscus syriacus]KAE8727396.1 protein TRANSPARENT TESTA 12-like [Hibiscus syriacus]